MAAHRYQVLVTHSELPEVGLEILKRVANVIICHSMPVTREEILLKCPRVHGILWACSEMLDEEILNATGPMLKAVSCLLPTIDHIDVRQLQNRRIPLGHTKAAGSESIADVAIGLMISAARRFHEARTKIDMSMVENYRLRWMLGKEIRGSTVGFIGFGRVGQAIAKRLRGFDIRTIIYHAHNQAPNQSEFNATDTTFEEVLKQSDFLFITCPQDKDTKGMFDENAFKQMKPTSVLINTTGAQVVDQSALLAALTDGKIFAAGIDVIHPEPFPPDEYLLTLPNFIVTPHLGTATRQATENMAVLAAKNLVYGLMDIPMTSPAYELQSMLDCEEPRKFFYRY